jgi:hypothetical protein
MHAIVTEIIARAVFLDALNSRASTSVAGDAKVLYCRISFDVDAPLSRVRWNAWLDLLVFAVLF